MEVFSLAGWFVWRGGGGGGRSWEDGGMSVRTDILVYDLLEGKICGG